MSSLKMMILQHGGCSRSGHDPLGAPGALGILEWLYRSMDFVRARGAGGCVLGIQQGVFLQQGCFFLFYPMCLYSKYYTQKFVENSKMDEKHKKTF